MITFSTEYNIGDNVFYATPDGDRGVIVDVSYSLRHNQVKYEVVFGRFSGDDVWCFSEELSTEKVF